MMKTIILLAACAIAAPSPQYYRVVGEIGIVGRVIGQDGDEVFFVPCVGPTQVLLVGEIEPTLNTCADGRLP
jgi:hypothetical protein